MTREEARKAAEVMLAYANGEEVETLCLNGKHVFIKTPSFNWGVTEYRVKLKPTFRPFKDMEECWNEMLKHKPFGWIKSNEDGHYAMVTTVDVVEGEKYIAISGNNLWSFDDTINNYTFADGTPFGIKEN